MDPNQFAQIVDQSGQVPMMVSEVRRRKALAVVLGQAEVVDSEGNKVDLSDFVRPAGEDAPSFENVEEAEEATVVPSDDPAAVKF
jgi:trigger factor